MKIDQGDKHLIESEKVYLSQGYPTVCRNGKNVAVHTIIMGKSPDGLEVDHINRDRSDNRRCNLRFVTRQENMINRAPWSKSGLKGVYFDKTTKRKKPWQASIKRNGVNTKLGYFATKEEAAKARLLALTR